MSARPRPPVPLPPLPDDLRAVDLDGELWEDEGRIEHVALAGVAGEAHADLVTIAESRITGSLARARLPRVHVRDCVVAGADLANLHARGGALHRCTIADARLTGATLAEAALRDVTLVRCRADLASFAGAALERVVLEDCVLTEASFEEAQLRDVRFERCELSGAAFHRARLSRVELARCELARVRSVSDLRGAVMAWEDVLANAGALAAGLGIAVLSED